MKVFEKEIVYWVNQQYFNTQLLRFKFCHMIVKKTIPAHQLNLFPDDKTMRLQVFGSIDLKGKIVIKPMPVWNQGEPRSAGMGGTGTAVTKTSKNQEAAKSFLAYAKLSKEGNIEIWKQLGFDPLRSDVWDAPELKESNKFTDYFGPNIFDVLTQVKSEIEGVIINEQTPTISDAFKTSVMTRILLDNEDVDKVLSDTAAQLK